MAPQDLKDLGFKENNESGSVKKDAAVPQDSIDWESRKQRGFVAGIKR